MSSPQFENKFPGAKEDDRVEDGRMANSSEVLYDPGPSFVGKYQPELRLAEMPAWLQTFAASAETMAESLSDAEEFPLTTTTEIEEDYSINERGTDLPDIVDVSEDSEKEATSELAIEASVAQQKANYLRDDDRELNSLISEDDLPEWLRSVSTGTTRVAASAVASPKSGDDVSRDVERAPSVPAISRAWVTGDALMALSDSGSTFALVAQQTSQMTVPESYENAFESDRFESPTSRSDDAAAVEGATTSRNSAAPAREDSIELEPAVSEVSEVQMNRSYVPLIVGSVFILVLLIIVWMFIL